MDVDFVSSTIVSIIIPCYKQAEFLPEALDSIISQTYKDWECIIVDDGSPDNTQDIAIEYGKRDGRIKYLKQENQGVSIARNNGIFHSSGRYILPLDGDDKIAPSYIAKAVSYLDCHLDCKLVYCQAEKFGAETGLWQLPDYDFDSLRWRNVIFCTAMFRRDDFNRTNGYNPNMIWGLEDWDFWLSLLSPKDIVYRIDEVLFYYRVKSISRTITLVPKYEICVKQICMNHPELYTDAILQHNKVISQRKVIQQLQNKIDAILNSNTYRIGKLMLSPYRLFMKIFQK